MIYRLRTREGATGLVSFLAGKYGRLAALSLPDGQGVVVNNGAAGMPNFLNTRHGLITRIDIRPAKTETLYGARPHGVHIDALPAPYDHDRWLREFLGHRPPGSPAYESYYQRILRGPDHTLDQAVWDLTA